MRKDLAGGPPALSSCSLMGQQCRCKDIWCCCAQPCAWNVVFKPGKQFGSNLPFAHLTWKLVLQRLPVFISTSFPFAGPCATCMYHRGCPSSQLLLPLKALRALLAAQISTYSWLLVACSPPALQQSCFLIAQQLYTSSSLGNPVNFWAIQW